jgi:dTDP-4-dehydrorhamnose reductase
LLGQSLLNLLLEEKGKYKVFSFLRGENRSGREDFYYVSIDLTETENHKDKLQGI